MAWASSAAKTFYRGTSVSFKGITLLFLESSAYILVFIVDVSLAHRRTAATAWSRQETLLLSSAGPFKEQSDAYLQTKSVGLELFFWFPALPEMTMLRQVQNIYFALIWGGHFT